MNMIKVLWCRFQQCLGTFTILLVEASSETGLFRHLSDYVFGVRKIFSFWDNCIWIGIVKLSLLRTGCFSSEANVLRSSPKIWHVNKRDFFKFNWPLQYSMNMIKMLWCRFQQCLWTSAMLLLQGSSETGLFSYLSNHNFGHRNFGNTKAMRVIFF